MKKHIRIRALVIFLCFVMLLTLMPAASFAASKAVLSPQKLAVDGKLIDCEKYNIGGSNYFKLRDIAQLVNGTENQFSVGWDSANQTISITPGAAYESVGGELDMAGGDKSSSAVVSAQTVMINGEKCSSLSVYNIGGNNYFKLRDLGDKMGFAVNFDSNTNSAIIDTHEQGTLPPRGWFSYNTKGKLYLSTNVPANDNKRIYSMLKNSLSNNGDCPFYDGGFVYFDMTYDIAAFAATALDTHKNKADNLELAISYNIDDYSNVDVVISDLPELALEFNTEDTATVESAALAADPNYGNRINVTASTSYDTAKYDYYYIMIQYSGGGATYLNAEKNGNTFTAGVGSAPVGREGTIAILGAKATILPSGDVKLEYSSMETDFTTAF